MALKINSGILSDKGFQPSSLSKLRLGTTFNKKLFNVNVKLSSSVTILSFSIRTIFPKFFHKIYLKGRVQLFSRIFCYLLCFKYLDLHSILFCFFFYSYKRYRNVPLFIVIKFVSIISCF